LYKHFQQLLIEKQHTHVSELLRDTFLMTDIELEKKKGMHSGCTAIIGYIQSEERLIEGVLKKRRVLYTANVGDARAVLS
jgi:protein phosphatase PTC1